MIYKEISFAAAMQMVVGGDTGNLFWDTGEGLKTVEHETWYLSQLRKFKWFKRIPKEEELK